MIVEYGKSAYKSTFENHIALPSEIVGFAILELMLFRDLKIISVEELIQSSENYASPGSIFRLNEASFMLKIEELARNYPEFFVLRETAGLRQLFLDEPMTSNDLLHCYYTKSQKQLGAVA